MSQPTDHSTQLPIQPVGRDEYLEQLKDWPADPGLWTADS